MLKTLQRFPPTTAEKVLREYRQLNQTQLAHRADISRQYLSQIEAGTRKGSIKAMKAIAKALNVALDELCG